MPEEKHPIDHISKGEGYICNHCGKEILLGEMYFHFRRRTGWYKAHTNLVLCHNNKKEVRQWYNL